MGSFSDCRLVGDRWVLFLMEGWLGIGGFFFWWKGGWGWLNRGGRLATDLSSIYTTLFWLPHVVVHMLAFGVRIRVFVFAPRLFFYLLVHLTRSFRLHKLKICLLTKHNHRGLSSTKTSNIHTYILLNVLRCYLEHIRMGVEAVVPQQPNNNWSFTKQSHRPTLCNLTTRIQLSV